VIFDRQIGLPKICFGLLCSSTLAALLGCKHQHSTMRLLISGGTDKEDVGLLTIILARKFVGRFSLHAPSGIVGYRVILEIGTYLWENPHWCS
jgi:hypothetical protein